MSDESDIGNNRSTGAIRKRPAIRTITSDSSDSSIVTAGRSRKQPVSFKLSAA